MKRFLLVVLFTLTIVSVKCQDFSREKSIIDKEVTSYIDKGLYINASDLLVNFAINLQNYGDTLSALHYQLENCKLVDNHIDYFLYDHNYLTWESYFANWYMTISLEGWTNRKHEGALHLFSVLRKMQKEAPTLLPFYASTLAYIIDDFRDPTYNDSIYLLQNAIDIIKSQTPTHDLVKQYLRINTCFNRNRFYNSFNDVWLTCNRLPEIKNWYLINSPYIHNLDSDEYHDEIVEYETDYSDLLYFFASTIGSQENNELQAIELYKEEISILYPLLQIDTNIFLKISACNAKISHNYYMLGDRVKSKEYNDLAIKSLFDFEDSYEYCDLLNSVAFNYWNIRNSALAAQYKLHDIIIREINGWCSQSDWSLFFMYVVNDNPLEVLRFKDLAISAKHKYGESYGVYQYIGKAYSMLMDVTNSYKDSADYYNHKAECVLRDNYTFYDNKGLLNNAISSIKENWSTYYMRLGDFSKSYNISKEALSVVKEPSYIYYSKVAYLASLLHDIEGIHDYLPKFYYGIEEDLYKILPILGSVEADKYLECGDANLYKIPEWASWNPNDSVSVTIAYDAAILMKGLTLRYNTLAPYISGNSLLINAKQELNRMRDSIYSIPSYDQRVLALYKYEQAERVLLRDINNNMVRVHWRNIKNNLRKNEACIEFVKYNINAYYWSDSIPRPHYAALILKHDDSYPIFVNLFDEDELMDMYNLQPKSYDNEIGLTLYSKIWGKLQQYIDGNNRVFFSPMGLLNLINVELLTDSTGMTAAERFNLYRVSSTRNILTRDENRDIHSVAMFGGVDYENAQEYDEMLVSMNTRGNWAYLQNTLLEVEQIEDLLKGSGVNVATHTGSFATEGAFKQLDGTQANIVHIASHGYYIPQTQRTSVPYFSNSESTANIQDELFYSGLILSGGQKAWADSTFKPDNNDGILTAYEISKLDLHNVNLVVLSACETGLGDDLFDGIFGLQRAFKKAGVSSILMSLWQIDDRATSEYMSLFYEKLLEGYSKHDAYISTVLTMKEKYPDANYWASFVLLD